MNKEGIQRQTLLAHAEAGHTIVTGNQRLAAALQDGYADRARADGRQAWQTPAILTWNAWLQQEWQCLLRGGLEDMAFGLLNSAQQEQLWRDVQAAHGDAGATSAIADVRGLMDAWQLVQDWCLDPAHPDFQATADTRQFAAVALAFDMHVRDLGLATVAELPARLARSWNRLHIKGLADPFIAGPPTWLVGFVEITPAQERLIQALQQAGREIQQVELQAEPGASARLALADSRAEVSAAANWVRVQLDAHPRQRIAVIVPEMHSLRPLLERALNLALQPSSQQPGTEAAGLVNFSLGNPLADIPLISDALRVLRFEGEAMELAALYQVLRSPYFAGAEKAASARIRLELKLRRQGLADMPLSALLDFSSDKFLRKLAAGTERLDALRRKTMKWSDWADAFTTVLTLVGWSRGRTLSSNEYQATRKWEGVLDALAGLDRVSAGATFRQALLQLEHLAQGTIFQPESVGARVQVLGVLETTGQHFDQAWVLGMHDGAWPRLPQPNPYIPWSLQREHGLPRSGAQRELRMAAIYTRQLKVVAERVLFSHPEREGDQDLRVSPLIAELPVVDCAEAGVFLVSDWNTLQRDASVLEPWSDDLAPAYTEGERTGGSRLFELQAACPFRAFAEIRLHAKTLDAPAEGLDAMGRGSLVHKVLEFFWQATVDHAGLQALDEVALQERLAACVEDALCAVEQRSGVRLPARFRNVESARLAAVCSEMIALDRDRAPFRVLYNEEKRTVDFGGVSINLKLDRVDELASGGTAVIDYKTGQVNKNKWAGRRPESPQLPLYTLAVDEPVQAVAFASVRAGETRYEGIAAADDLLPGVKVWTENRTELAESASWEDLLEHWHEVLDELAGEFREGHAEVLPLSTRSSCTYCDLHPVCRINQNPVERQQESDDE